MSDGLEYSEKFCYRCGKSFIVHDASEWAYKRYVKGYKYFCSWSCLCKWDANRGTKIDRRQKIIEMLIDGKSVDEICDTVGVDRTNVLYWKRRVLPTDKDERSDDDEVVYMG